MTGLWACNPLYKKFPILISFESTTTPSSCTYFDVTIGEKVNCCKPSCGFNNLSQSILSIKLYFWVNFGTEINLYQMARDRFGVPTGAPEDENNHAMDAFRYGFLGIKQPNLMSFWFCSEKITYILTKEVSMDIQKLANALPINVTSKINEIIDTPISTEKPRAWGFKISRTGQKLWAGWSA